MIPLTSTQDRTEPRLRQEGVGPAYREEKLTTFLGSLLCQQCFLKSILNCSCCSLSCFHFYALPLEGDNCEQLEQDSEGAISLAYEDREGTLPSHQPSRETPALQHTMLYAQDPEECLYFCPCPPNSPQTPNSVHHCPSPQAKKGSVPQMPGPASQGGKAGLRKLGG